MAGPILVLALVAIPLLMAATLTYLVHRAYRFRVNGEPRDVERGQNDSQPVRRMFAEQPIELCSLPYIPPQPLERTDLASLTQRSIQSNKQTLNEVKGLGGGFVEYTAKRSTKPEFLHEHNIQEDSNKRSLDIVAPEPVRQFHPSMEPYLPDPEASPIWKQIDPRESPYPTRKSSNYSHRSVLRPAQVKAEGFGEIDLGSFPSSPRLDRTPSLETNGYVHPRASHASNGHDEPDAVDPAPFELPGSSPRFPMPANTDYSNTSIVDTPIKLTIDTRSHSVDSGIKHQSDGFGTAKLHQTPPVTPRTSKDETEDHSTSLQTRPCTPKTSLNDTEERSNSTNSTKNINKWVVPVKGVTGKLGRVRSLSMSEEARKSLDRARKRPDHDNGTGESDGHF